MKLFDFKKYILACASVLFVLSTDNGYSDESKRPPSCIDFTDELSCTGKKIGAFLCKWYPEHNGCFSDRKSGDNTTCEHDDDKEKCLASSVPPSRIHPKARKCLWLTDIRDLSGTDATGCRPQGYINGYDHPLCNQYDTKEKCLTGKSESGDKCEWTENLIKTSDGKTIPACRDEPYLRDVEQYTSK